MPLHQSHPQLPQACAQPVMAHQVLAEPIAKQSPRTMYVEAPRVLETPRMVRSESVNRAMQRNDSLTKVMQPEACPLPPQLPQRQPTMSQQSQQSLQSQQTTQSLQSQQTMQSQQSWRPSQTDFLSTPRPHQHQEQLQQIERLQQQMAQLMSSGSSMPTESHTEKVPQESAPARLPKEMSVGEVSKWNPFEQLLHELPTAGRNKARTETATKLRDTMGVFGPPQPPTPNANAGRPAIQQDSDGATSSFVPGPQQFSPSPGRAAGSAGRSASPAETPTSFILSQPQRASLPDKINCGGDAYDSYVGQRGEHAASFAPKPAATDPPSPPHKLQMSNSAGFTDRVDLAAVASAVPNSIPGSRAEKEPVSRSAENNRAHGSRSQGATPDKKVRLSSPEEREAASCLSKADQMLKDAVSQVSLRDLSELRSFRNPPVVVCQVVEAVAVALGMPDSRWSYVRKQLDKNFMERLCSFQPACLSAPQQDKLRSLLQVPAFSDAYLVDRCVAVAALAQWCNVVGRIMDGETDLETEQVNHLTVMPMKPDLGGLTVTPDLWSMEEEELAQVDELTIKREGVGCVTFHGQTDCRELAYRLPDVVVLNPGEVVVYPNHKVKPSIGSGLNKPASIKLYGCHPKTQVCTSERSREKYKNRVKSMTEEKGAEFVDYDCDNGVWEFRVSHF